tara:strand:+ start:245 stop:475 length:231 start_codon:yes stop_codon:yes gene_type:complete
MKKINKILEWLNLHCEGRLVITIVEDTNKFNIRDVKTGELLASNLSKHLLKKELLEQETILSFGGNWFFQSIKITG